MATIDLSSYTCEGKQVFSREQARRILGISHPTKFREHLEALGLNNQLITWDVIRAVLASRLFVAAGNGKHTKQQFGQIYRNGLMEPALRRFHINLDENFERIKNGYNEKSAA